MLSNFKFGLFLLQCFQFCKQTKIRTIKSKCSFHVLAGSVWVCVCGCVSVCVSDYVCVCECVFVCVYVCSTPVPEVEPRALQGKACNIEIISFYT